MATATEKYVTGDDELFATIPSNTKWVAQTFTIGTVGVNIAFVLTSVEIRADLNSSDETITVEIYEVNPDGSPKTPAVSNAISTGTISSNEFVNQDIGSWASISMSAVTLQPSRQYALVIRATVNEGIELRADGSSPTYAGGSVWVSTSTGSLWTEDTSTDIMFQINGADSDGTLCTTGEAITKAGAEASSTATNPLLVSQFVQQSEGYINSESEFNWIDNYANLNDDVKFILNRTCSADAAIGIITYDIGNYTSRVLAETMVNIYREQVFQGINILKDEAKRNFLKSNISSP